MQKFKEVKNNFRNQLSSAHFEILVGVPLITQIGNEKLIIENYKNILEIIESSIKLNTSVGIFLIGGENLIVKEMTSDTLIIEGRIKKVELI